MQPENNMGVAGAGVTPEKAPEVKPEIKTTEPEVLKKDNLFENTPKKSGKGMLYGLIFCAILAVGGIGFGVWAMMDGNAQKNTLNEQIGALKMQINKLQEGLVVDTEDEAITVSYKNPVIKSNSDDVSYSVGYESSYILGQGGTKRVNLSIINGKIDNCAMYEKEGDGWRVAGQCNIGGLDGNIFKVAEFGEGQENSGNMIGFIMEDGRVAYIKLYDFETTDSVNIKGYLDIDKQVIDALEIGVRNGVAGGYGSTIFVLSDGSFVKYDSSMIK